ncbi:MAG TPA: hypothetical protein VGC64_02900 [Pyrinomonadaceae bacterium]|jgi:hypothetical protein
MRIKYLAAAFALFALSFGVTARAVAAAQPEALARAAVSAHAAESGQAIAALRAMGPEGLQTLLTVYAAEIKQHLANSADAPASAKDKEAWQRLSAALDAVAQQYDSATAGLYWYTDLDQAGEAARKSGKPILSLRLLGNLNEEFSCANSRFFRTVLYANSEVSSWLRENFILHWKSVRPVPRVTVDYGDGRKLERTLTGNSIHYILDSQGRVIDALPGLYGPQAFLSQLHEAASVIRRTSGMTNDDRAENLRRYHQARIAAITQAWKADVESVGAKLPEEMKSDNQADGQTPSARRAARLAMSKAITETSIINSITYEAQLLAEATDNETWNKIAARHAGDAKLDGASLALMRRQSSSTNDAPQGVKASAASASRADSASNADSASRAEVFAQLVSNFERYVALDTVRNEYLMHTKLHAWLSMGMYSDNLDDLNQKVYSELFLTPGSDPWLGLYSPDTYTALEGGGVKSN